MIVIGIDPGKGGGLASISDSDSIRVYNCPDSVYEMSRILYSCKNYAFIENEKISVAIELVHAFPTDRPSTAFKFGNNYGSWLGIIETLRIPHTKVSPQKWMKDFQPLSKEKRIRKNELKEMAKDIYPKATLKTADAICIALYGLHTELDNWKKDKNET